MQCIHLWRRSRAALSMWVASADICSLTRREAAWKAAPCWIRSLHSVVGRWLMSAGVIPCVRIKIRADTWRSRDERATISQTFPIGGAYPACLLRCPARNPFLSGREELDAGAIARAFRSPPNQASQPSKWDGFPTRLRARDGEACRCQCLLLSCQLLLGRYGHRPTSDSLSRGFCAAYVLSAGSCCLKGE